MAAASPEGVIVIETKIGERRVAAEPRSRRTKARDSLFLAATIKREGLPEGRPVRVRNLSSIGLMADYDDVAVPGEQVVVTVRGIGSVAGKVAWIKRGRLGITFDCEVDPLMARKPVVKKAPQPSPRRPL